MINEQKLLNQKVRGLYIGGDIYMCVCVLIVEKLKEKITMLEKTINSVLNTYCTKLCCTAAA